MPAPVLGVAAVSRKLYSAPMQALLTSVLRSNPHLQLIPLDEHLMKTPIASWPIVDVLLTLYSVDFPLQKVLRYVDLRQPILVNNLYMQPVMMDRRRIRKVLASAGVPTPPAISLDRSQGDIAVQSGHNANTLSVYSHARGRSYTISKPFVEKPVDPHDHNVYIYYKDGGIRKLFRKVGNSSSSFSANETSIRQSGDYVYEQFYQPKHCADVKVYAVGKYCHAESRKAPHIDGIVERDQCGRERRREVSLSPDEIAICSRVASAFDQFIIGFDLLRGPGSHRFIIDVNGWSLVKNSDKYPEKAGKLLADHIQERLNEKHRVPPALPNPSLLKNNSTSSSGTQPSTDLFDASQGHGSTCMV